MMTAIPHCLPQGPGHVVLTTGVGWGGFKGPPTPTQDYVAGEENLRPVTQPVVSLGETTEDSAQRGKTHIPHHTGCGLGVPWLPVPRLAQDFPGSTF